MDVEAGVSLSEGLVRADENNKNGQLWFSFSSLVCSLLLKPKENQGDADISLRCLGK